MSVYIYIFGTPQALTKQYKTVLFITAHPHAGSDEDLSDSDMEIDADKFKAQQAESRALTERKNAGLPELEVDQLPSTIANKMMTLFKKECGQVKLHFILISFCSYTFASRSVGCIFAEDLLVLIALKLLVLFQRCRQRNSIQINDFKKKQAIEMLVKSCRAGDK